MRAARKKDGFALEAILDLLQSSVMSLYLYAEALQVVYRKMLLELRIFECVLAEKNALLALLKIQ